MFGCGNPASAEQRRPKASLLIIFRNPNVYVVLALIVFGGLGFAMSVFVSKFSQPAQLGSGSYCNPEFYPFRVDRAILDSPDDCPSCDRAVLEMARFIELLTPKDRIAELRPFNKNLNTFVALEDVEDPGQDYLRIEYNSPAPSVTITDLVLFRKDTGEKFILNRSVSQFVSDGRSNNVSIRGITCRINFND